MAEVNLHLDRRPLFGLTDEEGVQFVKEQQALKNQLFKDEYCFEVKDDYTYEYIRVDLGNNLYHAVGKVLPSYRDTKTLGEWLDQVTEVCEKLGRDATLNQGFMGSGWFAHRTFPLSSEQRAAVEKLLAWEPIASEGVKKRARDAQLERAKALLEEEDYLVTLPGDFLHESI